MSALDLKKILVVTLVTSLCGCARIRTATDALVNDTVFVSVPHLVQPLPLTLSVDNLTDATFSASFTADDFRWMGGNLTLSVYEETLYDAVEVGMLAEGDTLLYQGQEMLVRLLEETASGIEINGGVEQGGASLYPYEGGTYRAVITDDHSVYQFIGRTELPLSDDFTIHDAGDNPTDPITVITEAQKPYMDMLETYRREFNCLNTRVTVENGMITDITRRWIP